MIARWISAGALAGALLAASACGKSPASGTAPEGARAAQDSARATPSKTATAGPAAHASATTTATAATATATAAATATSPDLSRLCADRPALAQALAAHPRLRAWLAARLDGQKVTWDPTPPTSGQPAEHLAAERAGAPARVRVAPMYSGVDQLAQVVYEVLNSEGDAQARRLWSDAVRGRLDREGFALRMFRTEHRALVRFQRLARAEGLAPGPDDRMLRRMLDAPTEEGAYLAWAAELRRRDGGHDVIEYWRRAYDQRPR